MVYVWTVKLLKVNTSYVIICLFLLHNCMIFSYHTFSYPVCIHHNQRIMFSFLGHMSWFHKMTVLKNILVYIYIYIYTQREKLQWNNQSCFGLFGTYANEWPAFLWKHYPHAQKEQIGRGHMIFGFLISGLHAWLGSETLMSFSPRSSGAIFLPDMPFLVYHVSASKSSVKCWCLQHALLFISLRRSWLTMHDSARGEEDDVFWANHMLIKMVILAERLPSLGFSSGCRSSEHHVLRSLL